MNNLTYNIINISDLENIDFSQIFETSSETIRKSLDETLFVIKWETQPSFLTDETVTPVQTLNHSECLTLMATENWTNLDSMDELINDNE